MKGEAIKLENLFDGSKVRFKIPLYQRNYDWTLDNCKQLFNDILKIHQTERHNHFFGSIVTRRDDDDRLLVIDGQQRITTISLIMIAIKNAYEDQLISCSDLSLLNYLKEIYLIDRYHPLEAKLIPIEKDQEAYRRLLFEHPESYIKNSNITLNYLYFYEEIGKMNLSVDNWVKSIEKLQIIHIRLDKEDDPQLIFESLNSTGLDLSEADKIRNYLLMSLSDSDQEIYYKEYWNKIEEYTAYKPTPFVRDYLTIKRHKIEKIELIYSTFKKYVEVEASIDRKTIMEDMLKHARFYHQIVDAHCGDKEIDKLVRQLNSTETTVLMPFVLALFKDAEESGMETNECLQVLQVVENYIARRIICGYPSNALTKVFSALHSDVKNLIEKNQSVLEGVKMPYLEVLKYILLKKQGTAILPRNEEVSKEFATRRVYNMPRNFRFFLFERLENGNSKETHDVIKDLNDPSNTISIEHIMPQTLNEQWKKALGENWEEIHETYLHTMANLTLTGYNSMYSNRSFKEKKEIENGFKDSCYRLNAYLKDCDEWTETQLKERQQLLLKKVFELWPMISSTFEPIQKGLQTASLADEDFEFTGKRLVAFTFEGTRYQVATWKDMLLETCKMCYESSPLKMRELCSKGSCYVHLESNDSRAEFVKGLYVWAENSTKSKISILRHLFMALDRSFSDLEFEVAPLEGADVSSTSSSVFLPYWKELESRIANYPEFFDEFKHRSFECKRRYIDLTFGQSFLINLYIKLPANIYGVQVYFNDLSLYDQLFAKKDEIGNLLKESLKWERRENKASAFIFKSTTDLKDTKLWPDMCDWMIQKALDLKRAFVANL